MEEKPKIYDFNDPVLFLKARIEWRRKNEAAFSVLKECKKLRRCSPSLVSLIIKGKRNLSMDRVDDLAKLMGLSALEKQHFANLIERKETGFNKEEPVKKEIKSGRRHVSTDFLSDWVNVYVKDAFRFPKIQEDPNQLYSLLSGIASPKRIDKSLEFLLRYGYLRKTEDGKIVEDFPLHIADPGKASQRIRNFHKAALQISRKGIEQYPTSERYANAFVMPLNQDAYDKLTEMISTFSGEIQSFAETNRSEDGKLYQILLNATPTGGNTRD